MNAGIKDMEGHILYLTITALEGKPNAFYFHIGQRDDDMEVEGVLSRDWLTTLRDAIDDALGEPPARIPIRIIGSDDTIPPARKTRGQLRLVK